MFLYLLSTAILPINLFPRNEPNLEGQLKEAAGKAVKDDSHGAKEAELANGSFCKQDGVRQFLKDAVT